MDAAEQVRDSRQQDILRGGDTATCQLILPCRPVHRLLLQTGSTHTC
jgi:hypothetical protein